MTRSLLCILSFFSLQSFAQTVLGDPKAIIYSMDVEPESKSLIAISDKVRVELWNYESQSLLKSWQLDSRGNGVAIANSTVVVAKHNGVVDIYDALTFEKKESQKLTEGIPLYDVKRNSRNTFIIVDVKGNIYKSDSSKTQLVFSKLCSTPEPIINFDFINSQDAIITFHANGKIMLWSLTGKLLKQEQVARQGILALDSHVAEPKIYVSYKNGMVRLYSIALSNFYNEIISFRASKWPVSLDTKNDVIAIGTTTGKIEISTKVGIYKTKLQSIANVIQILPDQLPKIILAIGTHGNGIRIISATNMKFN